jgi:hypothetical protein
MPHTLISSDAIIRNITPPTGSSALTSIDDYMDILNTEVKNGIVTSTFQWRYISTNFGVRMVDFLVEQKFETARPDINEIRDIVKEYYELSSGLLTIEGLYHGMSLSFRPLEVYNIDYNWILELFSHETWHLEH